MPHHLGVIALFGALSIYSLTSTLTVTIKVHNESLQNTVNTHNFDLPSQSKKGDHQSRQSSTAKAKAKVEGKKDANGNEDNATTEPELLHGLKLQEQEGDTIHFHSHSAVIGAGNTNSSSRSSSTRNSESENVPEISPLDLFVPLPLPSEVPDSIPSNFRVQEQATYSTNSTPPSIWFDALDTRGHRGYVADPTLLRRSVLQWHKEHPQANYWDRVQNYQSHLLKEANTSLVEACELVPGKSIFTQGGLEMLTERIKVDKTPTRREGCSEEHGETSDENDDNKSSNTTKKLKLFCGVYTHDGKRDSARLVALSYGWKCDGFLAFSTATIPSLGMVALLHRGKEEYANMFQKSRSIWSYVAMHYLEDYDYFHLAGDDMHMIVENFRSLMLEYESEGYSGTKQGRIFGQYQIKKIRQYHLWWRSWIHN
jgi:hypothetical protein